MRLPWRRRGETLPEPVRETVAAEGESVLAFAREAGTGRCLVATGRYLWLVDEDGAALRRASWVEVDAAVWQPEQFTLTVQWVADPRADQWRLDGGQAQWKPFTEALYDRVGRSIVVAVDLEYEERSVGRAAIRRDPVTQEMTPQLVWARGRSPRDPERLAHANEVLANLCESVGIAPPA